MFRRCRSKVLVAAPIAVAAALFGYPSNLPSLLPAVGSASSPQQVTWHAPSAGGDALAAGKSRKGASKARSAGRKSAKAGGASKPRRASTGKAAVRAGKNNAAQQSGRKTIRHRRLADPGSTHSSSSSHSGTPQAPNFAPNPNNEMLAPVEPERAGPVPTESEHIAPRRIVHVSAEDTPLSTEELALTESLALVVTPRGPYEPWQVQLQNTGTTTARISSDVRLLWFEATVPGKRKPVVCEMPATMRPKAAYAEERVDLQPRQELSFNIDPRFFCFENEDTSLLVPGTFLKPHYGWRTKTQKVWQQGKTKDVRLKQEAPFVAVMAGASGGLKELLGPGIALDDRFAEWSKTRITAEDRLPLAAETTTPEEGDNEGAPAAAAPPSHPTPAAEAAGTSGLELLMVKGSDAASATDINVVVAVRNRGSEAQRVFLRADQLSFIVWGPDGQVQCAPPFAYRAPDQQGLTTLAPGKRISMSVRLNEFCPTGTFARPGFYYVSADLPVLDNHDDRGRPLPRAEQQETPRVLEASFGRPLRIGSGDQRFNYWDVGTALEPEGPSDTDEQADSEEAPHSPEGHTRTGSGLRLTQLAPWE